MTDSFIRHLVAFIGTLVTLFAFVAGYVAAGNGWWWAGLSVIVVYAAIYKLVDL
jgi:hypothetical protein